VNLLADFVSRSGMLAPTTVRLNPPISQITGRGVTSLASERIDLSLIGDGNGHAVITRQSEIRHSGAFAFPSLQQKLASYGRAGAMQFYGT
jgi:hypothetical protein